MVSCCIRVLQYKSRPRIMWYYGYDTKGAMKLSLRVKLILSSKQKAYLMTLLVTYNVPCDCRLL